MNLKEIQQAAGAIFDAAEVPQSFNNDSQALKALAEGVAIGDRSHWGLIKITGSDRLRYLHNQSTNDFETLKPGQGCNTTFVTSTARTLDLATAYVTEDAVLLLVSPNRREQLLTWLDRFIFPFDKVELTDLSSQFTILSLVGSHAQALLSQLSNTEIPQTDLGNNDLLDIDGTTVRLAVGSGLATSGYTAIASKEDGGKIWSKLTEAGAIPFGDRLWENLRIQQGIPTPDKELTEDYNPLEAGLWHTVSFDKGCYIGQETIARLNTYKGVKQRLWGIKLTQAVEPQTPITLDDKKIGVLTSYTDTETGAYGLGYVRTKAGGEGLKVQVGDAIGELASVPFISHQYQ